MSATPPAASFSAPGTLTLNEVGTFTSTTASPDVDGHDITSVAWDFGDGTTGTGNSVTHAYTTTGTKTVVMTATDSNNESATATATVTVHARPTARFTIDPNPANVGQSVTFNGSTSSDPEGPVTYAWDLDGDGFDDGTSAQVSRAYTSGGAKTIRLRVTDSNGAADTDTRTLTVNNGAPTASFTISPSPANPNETVTFNGSGSSDPENAALTYAWDLDDDGFDDGSTVEVTRSYPAGGDKTIRLRVTDPSGASHTASKILTVNNAPPIARLEIPDNTVLGCEAVTFDGSGSSDPEGEGLIYRWDTDEDSDVFDDGTTATVTEQAGYNTPGVKTINLLVADPHGAFDIDDEDLVVSNAPPTARVEFAVPAAERLPNQDPKVPIPGQRVAFGSLSTDCEDAFGELKHAWELDGDTDFSDADSTGVVPTGPGTVVRFTSNGAKTLQMRVTDTGGATPPSSLPTHQPKQAIATVNVRVNQPPRASFVVAPPIPITDEEVEFISTSRDGPGENEPLAHAWEIDLNRDGDFGDAGETATDRDLTRTFATPGDYRVRLSVTDADKIRTDTEATVRVLGSRPQASFSFSPQHPLPGQPVSFAATSTPTNGKAIVAVEWDFDYDPASAQFDVDATGVSPTRAFASPGAKTVALRVSESSNGPQGAIDGAVIQTGTVTVNAPPQASFRAAPATPLTGDVMTFSSTASDPDGPLASQEWDLDDDGQFDDAAGAVASRSFALPGTYTIGLRVTDDRGASAVSTGQVRVAPRPLGALARIGILPGVTIQIAGTTTRRGADLTLLRVMAPEGSTVKVKCKGRGCPKHRSQRVEDVTRKKLRFKRFERSLRGGAKLTIAVTKEGFIGRHTKFKVKRRRAPVRVDRCIQPGERRPSECPPA